mmetsp:Transcript_25811/g.74320  ORF Transcript_25811/g.74320 Transcript_25811/m.74320 type:complete len:203 (+) Transcript_25811:174-782(+)
MACRTASFTESPTSKSAGIKLATSRLTVTSSREMRATLNDLASPRNSKKRFAAASAVISPCPSGSTRWCKSSMCSISTPKCFKRFDTGESLTKCLNALWFIVASSPRLLARLNSSVTNSTNALSSFASAANWSARSVGKGRRTMSTMTPVTMFRRPRLMQKMYAAHNAPQAQPMAANGAAKALQSLPVSARKSVIHVRPAPP